MSIKALIKYHYTFVKLGEKPTIPSADVDAEQLECPCIAARNEKCFAHFGKHFGSFLESYTDTYYMTEQPTPRYNRNENTFKQKSECKCF